MSKENSKDFIYSRELFSTESAVNPKVKGSSLNAMIDWRDVSQALRILSKDDLPFVSNCPYCNGKIRLYENDPELGARFFCFSCKKKGDMVDLVSDLILVGDPGESGVRDLLLDSGWAGSCDLDRKIKEHLSRGERQAAIEKTWSQASRRLASMRPIISGILTNLGINIPSVRSGGIYDSYGETIGVSAPGDFSITRGGDQDGWDEPSLAVAFYREPGVVRSIFKINERGVPVGVRSAMRPEETGSGVVDAGYVGGHLVRNMRSKKVLVTPDWLAAVKIMVKNSYSAIDSVPILGSIEFGDDYRTSDSYDILGGREPVFWSPGFFPDAIYRSILTGFQVAVTNGFHKSSGWLSFPHNEPSESYVKSIMSRAVHWPRAMFNLRKRSMEDYCEMIECLGTKGVDIEMIMAESGGSSLGLMRRRHNYKGGRGVTAVSLGNGEFLVESSTTGIYLIQDGAVTSCVLNCRLRIHRKINDTKEGKLWYCIEVCKFKKKGMFIVDSSECDDPEGFYATAKRMSQLLEVHMLYCPKRHREKLFEYIHYTSPDRVINATLDEAMKTLGCGVVSVVRDSGIQEVEFDEVEFKKAGGRRLRCKKL